MRRLLVALAFVLLSAVVAEAVCTKGTDCYCDCATGTDRGDGFKNAACATAGAYVSASASNPSGSATVLVCEDFEAPTLTSNTGVGNGAPYYGPPYDSTGGGFGGAYRGFNGYWQQTYGVPTFCGSWGGTSGHDGGASPTFGLPCVAGGLCGFGIWHVTDAWNANTQTNCGGAALAMIQANQFNSEVGTLSTPTGGRGSGGVFDGATSLGHRVPAGSTSDIQGQKNFPGGNTRQLGITMAMAYPNNSDASGIWAFPWKHDKLGVSGASGVSTDDAWVNHNQGNRSTYSPFFYMFQYHLLSPQDPGGLGDGAAQVLCAASLAAATVSAGTIFCSGGYPNYGADATSNYSRTVDWPDGTWGCVQAWFQNIGQSNMAWDIWFTGTAGRKHIFGISGFDGSTFLRTSMGGYGRMSFDSYTNANQGGGVPTVQVTFRYEDNVIMRAGAPVSCAQIGFTGAAGPTPPAAPQNFRFGVGLDYEVAF